MKRALLCAALLVVACGAPPRPSVLEEVDRTRTAAAAKEARELAPQAFLLAEKLRTEATRANDEGDRAGSEILGEQALAAYAHAHVLARLARAEARLEAANHRVEDGGRALAMVEEQQRRVAAEADGLETRIRVMRDALPLAPSEPASPDRERARLAAARALALQARLLCVATQMLVPDSPGTTDAFKSLAALDAELARAPARTPVDEAVRLRSACLSELTRARRPVTAAAPEAGAADALLTELGSAQLAPARDDRGVVVVLRDLFQGAALRANAKTTLATLGQVARAHPEFPVLVVVHGARGSATPRDSARAEAVRAALTEGGAARVEARTAGDALPVAPPRGGDAARRNDRVEVVFVAPAQ